MHWSYSIRQPSAAVRHLGNSRGGAGLTVGLESAVPCLRFAFCHSMDVFSREALSAVAGVVAATAAIVTLGGKDPVSNSRRSYSGA
jgi:hypothetical protein